ncbi:MAG: DUF5063 domain-containing protein [Muribaculaceae bacterium]|nr:DUF5063 domain-containing protein [Muribaculaceae bacterium]
MSETPNTPSLQLTALAVTYVRTLAAAVPGGGHDLLGDVLRLLPPIYTALLTIRPEGLGAEDWDEYESGAIAAAMDEEQYDELRNRLAAILGDYDMYLDTQSEDMRYSDTPIAVSLSEQLADIYQSMADFAATMAEIADYNTPEVMSDMKSRFHEYLSDTICSALRTANGLYQAKVLQSEE